jgi:hypothetical protein
VIKEKPNADEFAVPSQDDKSLPLKRKRERELDDHDYDLDYEWEDCAECENCCKRKKKIECLMSEVKMLKEQLKKHKQKPKLSEKDPIFKCKGRMMLYAGVNKRTFDDIYDSVSDSAKDLRYWRGPKRNAVFRGVRRNKPGPKRFLSSKNEMFMAMLKIKTGLNMSIIGDLFGVSATQVSRTCFTWWKFLARVIGTLVYNPEKEVTLMTRPKAFADPHYRDVRHIIDCTEVFIETPKSLDLAASCWSDYKHHHTIKFLVSIIPNGHINYISRGWTGRASDNYVTEHSGFLDMIEPYDKVMADRGFTIHKLLAQHFATLVMKSHVTHFCSQLSSCLVSDILICMSVFELFALAKEIFVKRVDRP